MFEIVGTVVPLVVFSYARGLTDWRKPPAGIAGELGEYLLNRIAFQRGGEQHRVYASGSHQRHMFNV